MVRGHTSGHTSGKRLRGSPLLDVYSDRIQHTATRDPENMSHTIPEGLYLTLIETRRPTQTAIHPAVCVMGSVFLCPLCPCPERLVDALCLNPLFGPPGKEIPFFWHPGCTRPLCELLSNTHKHQHTHMLALPTSPAKHTHCPPSS